MRWLRNPRFTIYIAVLIALVTGLLIGSYWIAPPNGKAVDGQTLQNGQYYIQYPHPGPAMPIQVHSATRKTSTETVLSKWKVLLLVLLDTGDLLVAIDSNNVEWKQLVDPKLMSHLKVSSENGEKKFIIYWQPKGL